MFLVDNSVFYHYTKAVHPQQFCLVAHETSSGVLSHRVLLELRHHLLHTATAHPTYPNTCSVSDETVFPVFEGFTFVITNNINLSLLTLNRFMACGCVWYKASCESYNAVNRNKHHESLCLLYFLPLFVQHLTQGLISEGIMSLSYICQTQAVKKLPRK